MGIDTIKQHIEILQAVIDGHEIEYRRIGAHSEEWVQLKLPITGLNFAVYRFRIKPEERHDWTIELRGHGSAKWCHYLTEYDKTENEIKVQINNISCTSSFRNSCEFRTRQIHDETVL